MGLVEELEARRAEVMNSMHEVDRQAAGVREQFEEALNDLRKQRLPLEERLKLIDALIKVEEG